VRIPSWHGPFELPGGLQGDVVAHGAEWFDVAVFGFGGVESAVEVRAWVVLNGAGGANVPDCREYGVLVRDEGPRQIPQLPDGLRRHERPTNQAVRAQLG
jgi:hypothetical protein